MPEENLPASDTIDVIVTVDDEGSSRHGEKAIFGSGEATLKTVPIETLKTNMKVAVDGIREVFRDVVAEVGDLGLQQIQVAFEITATGKLALVGSSLEAGGKGTITMTFTRR
ncbi:hypothetical protein [Actinoplanes sp. N902-109]|uniref:Pepco domain-containing protein n=1 Tax=Actinoplanes sp. (strain N902-109) TaxID=649831 RepID=UPI0003293AD5|nr:hypothetical protein [Actinoplanes sp. N902-109]AGL19873.1 hypothetical protein L083_6363 [Actinoplanes sp. N902-109]